MGTTVFSLPCVCSSRLLPLSGNVVRRSACGRRPDILHIASERYKPAGLRRNTPRPCQGCGRGSHRPRPNLSAVDFAILCTTPAPLTRPLLVDLYLTLSPTFTKACFAPAPEDGNPAFPSVYQAQKDGRALTLHQRGGCFWSPHPAFLPIRTEKNNSNGFPPSGDGYCWSVLAWWRHTRGYVRASKESANIYEHVPGDPSSCRTLPFCDSETEISVRK